MTTDQLTANQQCYDEAMEYIETAADLLTRCRQPFNFSNPKTLLEELLTTLTTPTLEEILYDLGNNPYNLVYSKDLNKLITHLDKICNK